MRIQASLMQITREATCKLAPSLFLPFVYRPDSKYLTSLCSSVGGSRASLRGRVLLHTTPWHPVTCSPFPPSLGKVRARRPSPWVESKVAQANSLTQPPSGRTWSVDASCCFHCLSAWSICLERARRACRIWLCLPSVSSRLRTLSPEGGQKDCLGGAVNPVLE